MFNQLAYTVADAAKAVGRDRSYLYKKIRDGHLSASTPKGGGILMLTPDSLLACFCPPESCVGQDQVRTNKAARKI